MKQLLFMIAFTLTGTAGAVLVDPYLGVLVYYLFAVLRPQFLWEWVLPPDVRGSYYVGLAAILGALIQVPLARAKAKLDDGPGEPAPRTWAAPHLWMFALGAWIAVTYSTAKDRLYAEPWAIEYLKIFVMFAVASRVVRSVRQAWWLVLVAATCLCYIAYEVNILYLTQGRLDIFHVGYGGLDNNGAGLMLAMGVPLCIACWETSVRWWRWGFLLCVPPIVHAVLMTYSRGAMLSLVVVVPLLWWRSRSRVQLAIGFLLLALLLPTLAGQEIRARFFSISENEADKSAQSRRESWRAGYAIARDHPVFGVGPRNADRFSLQYGADLEGRAIHSQYFQIAADCGFVGLGLYLVATFSVWSSVRRALSAYRDRVDLEGRRAFGVARAVEGSLAVFFFGATFLSLEVFELPYLLLLLGAQLSVLRVEAPEPEPRRASAFARCAS